MNIALYTITSSLHSEVDPSVMSEPFIEDIQACMGGAFEFFGSDFSTYGSHDRDVIFVRTGGTEGIFKSLSLPGDIRLLTSGESNSLAASMEILSYLRRQGRTGEILHGTPEYIASRILSDSCGVIGSGASDTSVPSPWIRPFPGIDLGGARLGVIGDPSDWLISSDVDPEKVKEKFGAELVPVPISELIEAVVASGADLRSFAGSVAVYDALVDMVRRYRLDGLTLRCFDLLDTVHNTGCLALARLNAEGVPSSCEGDIPALLTMMVSAKLTGRNGFQCNLSLAGAEELLFAHCTVPLDMLTSYRYDTHFESGIGTAIKGELPLGPVTVFKISPDLGSMAVIHAELVRNESGPKLCRTQVVLRAPGASTYFLTAPLANHHVIVPGHIFRD